MGDFSRVVGEDGGGGGDDDCNNDDDNDDAWSDGARLRPLGETKKHINNVYLNSVPLYLFIISFPSILPDTL